MRSATAHKDYIVSVEQTEDWNSVNLDFGTAVFGKFFRYMVQLNIKEYARARVALSHSFFQWVLK